MPINGQSKLTYLLVSVCSEHVLDRKDLKFLSSIIRMNPTASLRQMERVATGVNASTQELDAC